MPVTVRWNGTTTVEEATETPGDGTIGAYCKAFVKSRAVEGAHPRFTVEGEPLDAKADVGLLDGAIVFLTVDAPEPSEGPGADDDKEPAVDLDKPLDEMSVKELRADAKANAIVLGDARAKAAIIEVITAAIVERSTASLVGPDGGPVEVPDGGDPRTAEPGTIDDDIV